MLTAGTTYYIMIDGFAGAVGGFCIYLSNPPAAPLCATLLVPVDNATNVSAPNTPLFWSTAVGADGYNVALLQRHKQSICHNYPETEDGH